MTQFVKYKKEEEMRLSEIEKKARSVGVKDTWRFSKKDLIKTIQRKEGNFDCFGNAMNYCDQMACCWRLDCVK
jgi:hypothetical protein